MVVLFLAVLFQISTYCLSLYIFLRNRLDLKFILLILIGSQVIGFTLFPKLGIISILYIIIFFMIALYIKLRQILLSIILPIIALLLSIISEYILGLIKLPTIINSMVDNLSNEEVTMLVPTFLVFLFTPLLSLAGRYLFSKFKGHEMFFKRYGVLFTVLSVVTIVIFYVNILIGKQQGFSDENIQANSFLFLFYFVLLLTVFVVLTRMVNKEAKMNNKQLQYERLTEYTENLEGLYTDMQKFRHDYINILLTMSEYIRTKDIENLDTYFTHKILPISQGMQSDNFKLGTLQNVKIQEVKGIMSSKIIQAQELNIDAVIEVVEPIDHLNMDSIKLCRCLGIILDNAIEEALQCETPTLRMALIKREGTVLIVTTNSCRPNGPELYKIYEKGFSTKGTNRGLGLSNLKEIVSKCDNVTLDTYIKDDLFVQELEIFE